MNQMNTGVDPLGDIPGRRLTPVVPVSRRPGTTTHRVGRRLPGRTYATALPSAPHLDSHPRCWTGSHRGLGRLWGSATVNDQGGTLAGSMHPNQSPGQGESRGEQCGKYALADSPRLPWVCRCLSCAGASAKAWAIPGWHSSTWDSPTIRRSLCIPAVAPHDRSQPPVSPASPARRPAPKPMNRTPVRVV